MLNKLLCFDWTTQINSTEILEFEIHKKIILLLIRKHILKHNYLSGTIEKIKEKNT